MLQQSIPADAGQAGGLQRRLPEPRGRDRYGPVRTKTQLLINCDPAARNVPTTMFNGSKG